MAEFRERRWKATPTGGKDLATGETVEVRSPADRDDVVGFVTVADPAAAQAAVENARQAQPDWDAMPANERAECLERVADLLEGNRAELMALCVREGGKTLIDGINEVREA